MKTPCLKTGREFLVSGKMWRRFLSLKSTQIRKFYSFMDYLSAGFKTESTTKCYFGTIIFDVFREKQEYNVDIRRQKRLSKRRTK